MNDFEDLVGERLMIGLPGTTLGDGEARLFQDTRAAGLILYRRNFESPEQLLALLDRLEAAVGRRLLVATDHEGGRIVMLGRGTTIFPDNLAVGTAGEVAFAGRQGLIEALELRRLGVDLNLGPCLDVLTDRYSPNIGIRSYGKDPTLVARYGAARIAGMIRGGLSACAKHFPGKGHSPLDAHLRLPTIESSWDEMLSGHLPPFFAAIERGVECIMTSHPIYPKLDPSLVPATFSRLIVHDYLRGEVGFRGVIASDDLEMGAVSESCPIGEATVRAARAGHDLLLVCHTEAAQRAATTALVEAYRSGALPRRELEGAAERVRTLRLRRTRRAEEGPPAPEADGQALARAIAARAVTVVSAGRSGIRRALNGQVLFVFPRFSELAARITIEAALADERAWIAGACAPLGLAPVIMLVGMEPSRDEIIQTADAAAAADATVLFVYDAHLYPSNRELLEVLQARARNLVAVLLRDPYDATFLGQETLGITAFGFRRCQLEAVLSRVSYGGPRSVIGTERGAGEGERDCSQRAQDHEP